MELRNYDMKVPYGYTLDLGEGSSTIIVCHDYCNSRKKVVPMVASKKTLKIVVNDD